MLVPIRSGKVHLLGGLETLFIEMVVGMIERAVTLIPAIFPEMALFGSFKATLWFVTFLVGLILFLGFRLISLHL